MVAESTEKSLPLRECGLKSQEDLAKIKRDLVTPLAGVWIEIISRQQLQTAFIVTPLAGVWIEITITNAKISERNVTPLAGVWIEIYTEAERGQMNFSHSPCGSVD